MDVPGYPCDRDNVLRSAPDRRGVYAIFEATGAEVSDDRDRLEPYYIRQLQPHCNQRLG